MTNDSFDALVLSRNYKAPIQDLATLILSMILSKSALLPMRILSLMPFLK